MMIETQTSPLNASRRAMLEKYLRSSVHSAPGPLPPIPRRDPDEAVPLSFPQEQVWLHAQMAPDLPLYNEPVTIHYTGRLNVDAFERAFNEILRRHEAWRTSFGIANGRPTQIVHRTLHVTIPLIDLRHLPGNEREAEANRIATEDAAHPIDLSEAPLFRAKLIRLEDERHRLYLTLSHIIFDGVAIYRVFMPELSKLYGAFAAGQPSPFPELPFQYPDFACWQRRADHTEKLSRNLAYWRELLSGDLPVLDLPFDRPRKPVQTFRGSMYPWVLNKELMSRLKALSHQEGVTLFQTLLAAFAILLQRYSGQDDIPIGTVTSGRDHPGTSSLLGYFLNTLVLRLDLSGGLTFRDLLKRARNATIEALAHDSVPFGTLVNELRVKRDSSRNPLFQSLFTLEPPMPDLDPGWQLTQMDVDTGATKYDIYLELDERRDGILARYHYSTDLFDLSTIKRLAAEWTTLLEAIVATPGAPLHELPVLPEEERLQFQHWNATGQPYPQATIHELFELQAKRSPDAIALEFEHERMTYAGLDRRANAVAAHLVERGVGPEVLVGVRMERSIEMIVGLLGILKAGGAYIPLDPHYPEERIEFILDDAKPLLVLTEEDVRDLPAASRDENRRVPRSENIGVRKQTIPGNLAYVLYTSGSTGTPKGVQIEHRSVVNFLTSMQRAPGMTSGDVLVAVTTISFDIAGLEIYLPLMTGARIVLASSGVARDGRRLKELLCRSGATMMQATPSTWRMLVESGWEGSSRMKILSGGEALPPELAAALLRRGASVWNLYGPTETTIWSLVHCVRAPVNGPVPLGKPLANTRVFILDSRGNPVPIGARGELYLGGDGLARGYLNRPELTSERFVRCQGERLYKTGDHGRLLPGGSVEFLGRTDTQVKIRGFRIELGEIEAALEKLSSIRFAVVETCEVTPGDRRLVAYVVPSRDRSVTPAEIREFLRSTLPESMIPAHFVFLGALPMTPNGKVNRKALPAPQQALERAADAVVPPRNETEMKLAEIWESVLGIHPIGVRDDFFALGGHSILAVRLFANIEKTFGRPIPLATLLKAPTIERLAEILRADEKPNDWTSLVPIQSKGSNPPLFCIHGHYGEILFYRPLSQHLGDQQPFYALQAVASREGRPAHATIEDMAAHYLSEIRQMRPHGPYLLAGYCFGSLVAFEIAQRLRRAGEEVAFLGLFMGYDSTAPFLTRFVRRVRSHGAHLQREGLRSKLSDLTKNGAIKTKSLLWRGTYRLWKDVLPKSSRLFRNIPEMNLQAAARYRPVFYPGRLTVFLSGEVPEGYRLDCRTDLHGMDAAHIDLHMVPGERFTMLQDPHVAALARQLQACLNNAETTGH